MSANLLKKALQLFAHLDGEALNVALLMPVEEREQWKDLANSLSEYYNSPGRLAVVRWRFESPTGVDSATFATELGILAVRGFENMGECTRDLMIRNKFIAAQQSCELRRHLDGASADASIRDIVDSCQVWESHTEAGYSAYSGHGGPDPKFPQTIALRIPPLTLSHPLRDSRRSLGRSTMGIWTSNSCVFLPTWIVHQTFLQDGRMWSRRYHRFLQFVLMIRNQ